MNKITTLTIVGMAVLLMLSAMPASAIKEVSSFESAGPIVNATALWNDTDGDGIGEGTPLGSFNVTFNANELPMFYLDLDDPEFEPESAGESLFINLSDEDEIGDDEDFVYKSIGWEDENERMNIAWLGEKYLAVGGDVEKLSKYLVDLESDEEITLKQGDVWDIGEGFTLTIQDIDVNGEQVWMALEQDGSSIEDIIAFANATEFYNTTVAGESDVTVVRVHVEKVFAGMSANMAIIDDAEIISMDVLELTETEYFGMDFDSSNTAPGELTLTEDDSTSISRGKTVEIIDDFMSIRVGDTESDEPVRFYVYREITEAGLYEQHGPIVNATEEYGAGPVVITPLLTADDLPMFYQDLDDLEFDPTIDGESLNITLDAVDSTPDDGIIYTSKGWKDENDRTNIAWLGEKYLAVGGDVEKLSKYLVDLESDEEITLKQGDVWDIGEGFTLTIQDIDVNGEQVWMALEQDGSSIEDIIAFANATEFYNTTVAGESDVTVVRVHVDKVFAGMSANMAIIDDAEIISMDVLELTETEYFGMDFDSSNTPPGELMLTEDDGKSLSRGTTLELIDDFLSIRVGDTESKEPVRYYVYNEVQVGEGVSPITPDTGEPTEEATVDVNATVAPTTPPTTAGTEAPTEVVTPEPTKPVPGFEAVFAIAGLLAVAYLVLRKRE